MSEPIDPNATSPYGPPYGPHGPPPDATPVYAPAMPEPGQVLVMRPDGLLVPLPASPPPPPTHGRRNVLIAALAVLVLAAAAFGGYAVYGTRSSLRPSIPASFAGYTRLTNDSANRVENLIRSMGSGLGGQFGAILNQSAIGVFGLGASSQPSFVYVALRTDVIPNRPANAAERVGLMLQGALTADQTTAYAAGPYGGDLECGLPQLSSAVSETVCGWSDDHTSGLALAVNPPQSPIDLADLTNKLRAIIDR
jgi:hypothetical protein